jgi:D-arabinose 1-dehydrogenase-like Zn-dependent alcohol dehydrogenase
MTNHLHHEDGAFQEYIALDGDNLTVLPDDIDPQTIGPVLCCGITAYKVGGGSGSGGVGQGAM